MRGNVTRRGKDRWQLRVDAGYIDGERRQTARTITARSKKEAEAALQRWLVELGYGSELGSDASVAQLIHAQFEQARWGATYADDCRRVVRMFLPGWLAEMPVWRVRPADLDRCYAELERAGVSDHRVRRLHEVLSGSFGRAVRWQWVIRNPARDAQPPIPEKSDVRPQEPEQVRPILAAIHGMRWRGRDARDVACCFRLAMATGARRGELVALRVADVDVDLEQVVIRRALAYTPATGVFSKTTKTRNVRAVALDPGTLAELKAHMLRMREQALALGTTVTDETWLFGFQQTGEPWPPNFLTQAFERIRDEAAVRGVLNGLRHLQATHLLAEGIEDKTVSGRLGHSKVGITQDRYAAFRPARDREAARIVGAMFDD